jgi:hypothetical protein
MRACDDDSPALRLWASIPSELAEKLRPLTDLLSQDVFEKIQATVEAYSGQRDDSFREALRRTIETAIHQCLDAISQPRTEWTDWKAVLRQAGRLEFMAGHTTEPLQAALRTGARVVWRHICTSAPSLGIPTEHLFTMAEAIFVWADELSAVAIAGYYESQAKAPGHSNAPTMQEAYRRQLTQMILSGEPTNQEWVQALAHAARWLLPDQLVAIAVARRDEHDELSDIVANREVLVELGGATPCLLLADPGQNRQLVSDLLGGRVAAVGPAVGPTEANRSLLQARRLLGLIQTDRQPFTQIAWCQDHLATLLLLADPSLTAWLREHTRSVFAGLTTKQRDRLATTLLAWLQSRDTHTEIAARLEVHPQTLRYRLRQLQDLLGDKLIDPDARLTLELALRADLLLDSRQQPHHRDT